MGYLKTGGEGWGEPPEPPLDPPLTSYQLLYVDLPTDMEEVKLTLFQW